MGEFRQDYQAETRELDDSVGSMPGYRELHAGSSADDLPRFEADFKDNLNLNTMREIAQFRTKLSEQRDEIRRAHRARSTIRSSRIDYNRGTYIALEPQRDAQHRDPRSSRRAAHCTEGSLGGDGLRPVRRGEVPRRQADHRALRRPRRSGRRRPALDGRVTDVREWFTFSASERNRDDDTEREHYTSSGGKSGGQKEKLAYTILAASLAYQFKLEASDGAARRSGSSSSTRRSAAARTSRPDSGCDCSADSGCSC